jgi:hypothetical protein
MNLNLKNLQPLGFRGGRMDSKTSITLLWVIRGSSVFYTSGYSPNTVGVFHLKPAEMKKFKKGRVSLLPPGFCNATGGEVLTDCRILHRGTVRSKKHLMSIIDVEEKSSDPQKQASHA